MGIDWITFAAQMVNLAILTYLLYRFLFKPLLAAIDKREATIADEVLKSKSAVEKAEQRLTELNKKHAAIDEERLQILRQAREEANDLRLKLEAEVRAAAEETRTFWKRELERERKSVETDLRDMIVSNFVAFSKKALADLADVSLEGKIAETMVNRLSVLSDDEKKRLMPKNGGTADVVFTSAANLDPAAEQKLVKALNDALGLRDVSATFKVDPQIICGIEVAVNGQVVSWNLDAYLRDFSDNMNKAMEALTLRTQAEEK